MISEKQLFNLFTDFYKDLTDYGLDTDEHYPSDIKNAIIKEKDRLFTCWQYYRENAPITSAQFLQYCERRVFDGCAHEEDDNWHGHIIYNSNMFSVMFLYLQRCDQNQVTKVDPKEEGFAKLLRIDKTFTYECPYCKNTQHWGHETNEIECRKCGLKSKVEEKEDES